MGLVVIISSSILSRMDDKARAQPDFIALFALASTQQGYFTAAQAQTYGYGWALLGHHARQGRFIRVRRGVYRLRDYPSSPTEEVMAAWLIAGRETAIVSHESALDLLDLADVIPATIHLTVPRARRHLAAPPGVTLHTTARPLRPDELLERDGLPLTGVARTIVDCAALGTAADQLTRAVGTALARGLTTVPRLRRAAVGRPRRVATVIDDAIGRAETRAVSA